MSRRDGVTGKLVAVAEGVKVEMPRCLKRDEVPGKRVAVAEGREGGNSEVSERDEVPGKLVAVAEGVKLHEICGNPVSGFS